MEIKRVNAPSISFIVARSWPQNFIGFENRLLWRLRTDMRFFKKTTLDHAIIMGRKTYESIGHPLPKRLNIVLSRSPGNDATNLKWVRNLESALFFADNYSIINDKKEVFVIGGDNIYRTFKDLANKIFLTEVYHKFENGDASFEELYDRKKWKILEEKDFSRSDDDEYPFRITIMERRRKTVRQLEVHQFLSGLEERQMWVSEHLVKKINDYDRMPEEKFSLGELVK